MREKFQESIESYEEAEQIFEAIGETERANQARDRQADTWFQFAQYLHEKGEYSEASESYEKAKIIFEITGNIERSIQARNQCQQIKNLLEQSRSPQMSLQSRDEINYSQNPSVGIPKYPALKIETSPFLLKQLLSIVKFLAVGFVACCIGAISLASSALKTTLENRKLLFEYCILFVSLAIPPILFLIDSIYRLISTLFKLISKILSKIFPRLSIPVRLGLVVWSIWLIKIIEEQNFDFKMPWEKPEVRTSFVDRAVQYTYTAPSSVYRVTCPPNQVLNVRESPSFSGSVVSIIPCNSIGVEIIGSDILADGEIWVKIQYQTIHGWSVKRFLSQP